MYVEVIPFLLVQWRKIVQNSPKNGIMMWLYSPDKMVGIHH